MNKDSQSAPGGAIVWEVTHTPGPWQVFANSPGNDDLPSVMAAQPAGPGLFYVAQVNRIEDARLIAAAPELLEALRFVLCRFPCLEDKDLPYLHGVVAKATEEVR